MCSFFTVEPHTHYNDFFVKRIYIIISKGIQNECAFMSSAQAEYLRLQLNSSRRMGIPQSSHDWFFFRLVLSCLVLDSTFVIHLICVVVFYYLNLMVIHANDIWPIKSEQEIKANAPPVKCHSTKMRTLIIYTQTHTRKADLLNLIHRKIFFFKWNKQHV